MLNRILINRILITTATLAALACGSTLLYAQEASTPHSRLQGLSIGLHGSTAVLTLEDESRTEFGGGLGVAIGYEFSDDFSLHYVSNNAIMAARGRDYYFLTHRELEGRYTFGGRSRDWAPYLALGASGRATHFEKSTSQRRRITGRSTLGLLTGVGISYRLHPALALDWSLRYEFGNFARSRCPDTAEIVRTCATSGRVGFGASWYPFLR